MVFPLNNPRNSTIVLAAAVALCAITAAPANLRVDAQPTEELPQPLPKLEISPLLNSQRELVEISVAQSAEEKKQTTETYNAVLNQYKRAVKRPIMRAWFPPKDGRGAIISGRLNRDGTIINARVIYSARIDNCDTAALRAVQKASPVDVIPDQLPAPLTLVIDFRCSNSKWPMLHLYNDPNYLSQGPLKIDFKGKRQ